MATEFCRTHLIFQVLGTYDLEPKFHPLTMKLDADATHVTANVTMAIAVVLFTVNDGIKSEQ